MDEVFGCGIDVEELSRFDKYMDSNNSSLMEDICTERERDSFLDNKRIKFALSFSCKEAFFKALGVSWTNSNIFWKDIELLFSGPAFENYRIALSGRAEEMLAENNANIGEVSFDFDEEIVMFQVVLLKKCDEG